MAVLIQKLAAILLLLMVVISGEVDAAASDLMKDMEPDTKFLWCRHMCDDMMGVCVYEKCMMIPIGQGHGRCHMLCEESHLKCNQVCMEMSSAPTP